MKKLLSIVLALALVLSLAACGGAGLGSADNNLTEEKLKGTWVMEMNIAKLMDAVGDTAFSAMGLGDMTGFLGAIPDDMVLCAYMVFDGAGNSTALISKDDFNEFYTDLLNAILTEETMYAIYEAQGMDKATVDAALAAQGTSISSIIAMTKIQMSSMDMADTLIQSGGAVEKGDYIAMSGSTKYTIEGNTVVMDGSELVYDGTNLTITELSGTGDMANLSALLPLTIKRVSDKTEY